MVFMLLKTEQKEYLALLSSLGYNLKDKEYFSSLFIGSKFNVKTIVDRYNEKYANLDNFDIIDFNLTVIQEDLRNRYNINVDVFDKEKQAVYAHYYSFDDITEFLLFIFSFNNGLLFFLKQISANINLIGKYNEVKELNDLHEISIFKDSMRVENKS